MKKNESESKLNLWTIGWGLTSMCDLACPFCYSYNKRSTTLPINFIAEEAKIFLENNLMNIKSINFGTGESFLLPDFPNFLELCKEVKPNVNLAVTTNGAISNQIGTDSLKIYKNNINELDISIDFSDQLGIFRFKRNATRTSI